MTAAVNLCFRLMLNAIVKIWVGSSVPNAAAFCRKVPVDLG